MSFSVNCLSCIWNSRLLGRLLCPVFNWSVLNIMTSILFLVLYLSSSFLCGAATQRVSWPPHSWGFLDHTQRPSTVGRTPLDKWSARRRDLYLTTHNTHNRQTSVPLVGFEPTISAGERPQTYALDRAATGTGTVSIYLKNIGDVWDQTSGFWIPG